MAGQKNRRGIILGTRPRYVIGTEISVKRVKLAPKNKLVWMDDNGNIYPINTTELR